MILPLLNHTCTATGFHISMALGKPAVSPLLTHWRCCSLTFSHQFHLGENTYRCLTKYGLTHWGRVTHICVSKLTIIGSDDGLSPGRRQAIIWTNAGILFIEPLGTNFSEILIGIQIFSFTKMRLKMSSAKCRPFCLGLNVLMTLHPIVFREM